MLPATLVTAAGMAMAFIPSLGLALSSAAPQEGGLAAGIVNTSYQVGSALGPGRDDRGRRRVRQPKAQHSDLVGLTDGFSAALLGAAAIAAVGAVVAAAWLRTPAPQAPAEAASDEQVAA